MSPPPPAAHPPLPLLPQPPSTAAAAAADGWQWEQLAMPAVHEGCAPLHGQQSFVPSGATCWRGPTPEPPTPAMPRLGAAAHAPTPAGLPGLGAYHGMASACFLAALLAASRLGLLHQPAAPLLPTQQQQQQPFGSVRACDEADSAATLRHRALSFVRCLARSSVLQSALLSLELSGSHPPVGGVAAPPAEGLEWTLAQLLALHLRTGDTEATGGSLLAALWVLEAAHSSRRSRASTCLTSWLQHLAVFSPELMLLLVVQWPASLSKLRKALAKAQMRLLKRLEWRVRLDFSADVWPSLQLLFDLGASPQQQQQGAEQRDALPLPRHPSTPGRTVHPSLSQEAAAAAGATTPPPVAPAAPCEDWALAMHAYCANIRQQAAKIKAQQRQPTSCPLAAVSSAWQAAVGGAWREVDSRPGPAGEGGRAAKRQRTQL